MVDKPEDETSEDPIPPELEELYDPDEVFEIDATPEELAEALFKPKQSA